MKYDDAVVRFAAELNIETEGSSFSRGLAFCGQVKH